MVAKTIFVTLRNLLIYANYLKTAQPISIFSPKDAYLIFRQLQKRGWEFFTRFNKKTRKTESSVQLDPLCT